jgi:DNA-directed RNA polymerase sigma subunit (sigma70/sigma32)
MMISDEQKLIDLLSERDSARKKERIITMEIIKQRRLINFDKNKSDELAKARHREKIAKQKLTEMREMIIVKLRELDFSFNSIGKIFDLSGSRISGIHAKALRKKRTQEESK